MDFSDALRLMKEGNKCSRRAWGRSDTYIAVQFPDENSANTLPYIYMVKESGNVRFPLDLTCEAIFANDWVIAEFNLNEEE